jgi:hypothetical protein
MLIEENLEEIGNKLEHFHRKDHKCFEEEIGVSKNASTNCSEFRKLQLYKTTFCGDAKNAYFSSVFSVL